MIQIGNVPTFKQPKADKAQALKVVEEAAEVFSAWETWNDSLPEYDKELSDDLVANISYECADLLQATCNLLAALGYDDYHLQVGACKQRNEARGRAYE